MNSRLLLLLVLFLVLPELVHASEERQGEGGDKPSFGKVINELSRYLSSTNPEDSLPSNSRKVAKKLSAVKTASGNDKKKVPLHIAIPKNIDNYEKPRPIPIIPVAKPIINNQVIQEPMLSPEAKRIFRKSPSNLGIIDSDTGSLAIQRGDFVDELQNDKILDNQEALATKDKKFDIKVQDVKTTENEIGMLDNGLKALVSGQYEGAVAIYKAVLAKQAKNRDALLGLATAYHKAGQRTQARVAYSNLLSQYPNFQDGLNNFLMLAAEEAPQDALAELEQLSARNPKYAPIFAQKAFIYSKMGETDKAIANFTKAMIIAPDNLGYKYNLATIYDKSGSPEKARQLYSELLEESYKGKMLPVGRKEISERLEVISANRMD